MPLKVLYSMFLRRNRLSLLTLAACPTKISKTAEQANKYGHSTQLPKPARKQGRIKQTCPTKIAKTAEQASIYGSSAPMPKPTRKQGRMKQNCPTKISKTAEQANIYGPSASLQKPARQQGRIKPRNTTKIAKTAEQARKTMGLFLLLVLFSLISPLLAQNDDRWLTVDDFGKIPNDDLLARVDSFQQKILERNDADALVVLYGPRTAQYLNQRRIQGCNLMRKYPLSTLRFVFGPEDHETRIRFYLVAKGADLGIDEPDYKLPDLKKPIELNSAFATDEFCPLHFDLDWYANFMVANRDFRGKVVVDSSRNEFVRRVTKYRKRVEKLGVAPSRIKFIRRHFIHERDEQWWLIPRHKNGN